MKRILLPLTLVLLSLSLTARGAGTVESIVTMPNPIGRSIC